MAFNQEHPASRKQALSDLAFLGPEFLTWLYFHLEQTGGEIPLQELLPSEHAVKEVVRIGVGKRMTLKSLWGGDARLTVSGSMLDDSGEVLQAVRSGCYIDTMIIDLVIAERSYTFTLNSLDGSLSQVKMQLGFDKGSDKSLFEDESGEVKQEEPVDEETTLLLRMSALDEIDDLVDALFKRFLDKRLGQTFVSQEVQSIRAKVAEELLKKLPRSATPNPKGLMEHPAL